MINEDGSIRTKVYRKDTHTDQYLNFNSNHPLEHKRGVVRTLMHRANNIVSDPEDREREKEHVRSSLRLNGYPEWILKDNAVEPDVIENVEPTEDEGESDNEGEPNSDPQVTPIAPVKRKRYPIVIPYIKGTSEELRRIFKKYEVPCYFKPTNTLRQLLVRPKDQLDKSKMCGPVYRIPCEDCPASYVGETERSLKARFLEHRRPSSSTSEVSKHVHLDNPDHSVSLDNAEILEI